MREGLRRLTLLTLSFAALTCAAVVSGAVTQSDARAWLVRNWLTLTLLCAAVGLLLFAAGPRRGEREAMPPIRPISIRAVVAGLLMAALCAWLAVDFLLHEASLASGAQRTGLRIDAIRTGLTIGIGAGGAVTLLLAARRQWLGERSQAHTEEDAVERRVTDLYSKSIDQLGSTNAAVRLGGVYALERLAKQHVGIRQSIVNVLCAYLRMALPIDDTNHDGDNRSERELDTAPMMDQERHVRLTVQEVLFNSLRSNDGAEEQQTWDNIDLNLRGAHLNEVELSNAQVRSLDMTGCHLFGLSNFDSLRVTQNASFDDATFNGRATFDDAIFAGASSFSSAQFKADVLFMRVNFFGDANFEKAGFFSEHCWFSGSTFHKGTVFDNTEFRGVADFARTRFYAEMANFEHVRWPSNAYFNNSYFKGIVNAMGCEFAKICQFSKVQFCDDARFDDGKFLGQTFFREVEFNGAWFTDAQFAEEACFEVARVGKVAYFDHCEFENHLILNKSRFDAVLDLSYSQLSAQLQTENATFAADADLDGTLLSGGALTAVEDLWPSQWAATPAPREENGFSVRLYRMSRAQPAGGKDA